MTLSQPCVPKPLNAAQPKPLSYSAHLTHSPEACLGRAGPWFWLTHKQMTAMVPPLLSSHNITLPGLIMFPGAVSSA